MALSLIKTVRRHKRVGRGIGSRGAKSGRGMKGQKARAGYSRKAGFEGGQTPLYMRLPKERGSKQKFPSQVVKPQVVTTWRLNHFAAGSTVGPKELLAAGFIKSRKHPVKLIGRDAVPQQLTVRVHSATPGAVQAVTKGGGSLAVITSHE